MWNEIIKTFPLVAAASFILDAFIGDPRWLPHPVRFMGRVISRFDGKFNNESYNNSARFFAGALFSLCFTILTGVISGALLFVLFTVDFRLGILGEIIMSTYCLAAHDLIKHAMNVYNCRYNLDEARIAVGMIVGRETGKLSDQGVIKATVESIAESTCDGVIAPAFYILLFGPVGGMVYKAVNTMDSMIGYHNEKYEYYGKPAAIADDILNFIPSRISAVCIITASAMIRGMDHMGAFRIWRRDRYNHKSPNSAQTESAMAGALGMRLGGPAVYFGKKVDKPYIGDASGKAVGWNEIRRACILMYTAAFLMITAACLISVVVVYPS